MFDAGGRRGPRHAKMADGQARTEGGAMADTHEHKCSQCGTAWQHGDESNERFREHICPSCGYLELMVFKSREAPMGAADLPRAVANFLKVLTDSDESARAARSEERRVGKECV